MIDDVRCELCQRPTDGATCRRCGTVACRLHYDAELEFCAACAQRAKSDGRRGDTFMF